MEAKAKTAPTRRGKSPSRAGMQGALVVIGNLKGGSGKSTVAFNLAVWLATRGVDPALVDLDPQQTLTDLVAVRKEVGALPKIAAPAGALGPLADSRWTLVDFGAADTARMADVLPHADIVLVPVLPSQADIWATQRYLKLVLAHCQPGARIALFLNRAEPFKSSRETRETLAALKAMAGMCDGATVIPTALGRRVAFCRSMSEGQGVFELKEKSKAGKEFCAFARSVMTLC